MTKYIKEEKKNLPEEAKKYCDISVLKESPRICPGKVSGWVPGDSH